LAEQIATCGRMFRDVLAPIAGRRQLTESHLVLLLALRNRPPDGLGQSQIAACLAVSPAHVSTQLEQLRARGLLTGRRPASDRRRQLWRITAAGIEVVDAVLEDLAQWTGTADRRMNARRLAALTASLERLQAVLREHPLPQPPAEPGLRRFDPGSPSAQDTPVPAPKAMSYEGRSKKRRAAS
jgi:DNA-binding MarR family transcriptional regulator